MFNKDTDILTIGADIGGTKIEAALVNENGKVIASKRTQTNTEKGPDSVIDDLIHCYWRGYVYPKGGI